MKKTVEVTIKPIDDPEKYWEVVDVSIDAWGMKDYRDAVPAHMMKAIADNGGLVLAAFEGDKIVGFVLGILAMDNQGKLYHYSHQLAVRRKYRGTGVAIALKLAQRRHVLNQGLDLVTWTFDPQQGRNAKFNFAKLGVICRKFYRNYYGILQDEINRGLVTDRFKVKWWIKSKRVEKRINGRFPPPKMEDVEDLAEPVVETEKIAQNVRKIKKVNLDAKNDVLLVEVPGNVDKVREYSLELANNWRIGLRPVFEKYFSEGYIATEFISHVENGERRNFYMLWKAPLEKILEGEAPWR